MPFLNTFYSPAY